jgi:hypothetical protein
MEYWILLRRGQKKHISAAIAIAHGMSADIGAFILGVTFSWDFLLELEDFLFFFPLVYYISAVRDSVFLFLGIMDPWIYDGVKPPKGQDYGRSFFFLLPRS